MLVGESKRVAIVVQLPVQYFIKIAEASLVRYSPYRKYIFVFLKVFYELFFRHNPRRGKMGSYSTPHLKKSVVLERL